MFDWVTTLRESVFSSVGIFVAFLPKLFGALVLVGFGVLLGKVIGFTVTRVLQLAGVDRLLSRTAIQTLLDRAGSRNSTSQILGVLVFWVIFLLFLISAAEAMGLAIISQALRDLAYYLPKVGLAGLILVLGLLGANLVRELINLACGSAGIPQGPIVAQAFYVAAVLLVVVTAINELGIDTTLLNSTITLVIAGLIGGAALSFGLGARTAVANLIAAHYLQPVLRVGQKVKLGQVQGVVAAMTPIAVILETDDGRLVVPAAQFTDTTTLVSPPEG
ncbi:MAG: mechanosensitive ion channel family protein [Nitrospirales bacterium]